MDPGPSCKRQVPVFGTLLPFINIMQGLYNIMPQESTFL